MINPSPVAIIGATGGLGLGLSLRWAQAGVEVLLGSRDSGRAAEAAARVSGRIEEAVVQGLPNQAAARQAEIVVLSVPFRSHAETLNDLGSVLREGQVVVDVTVPLAASVGGKATRILGVWEGSAAQQAQTLVPSGVTVVSALHTVSAGRLQDLDSPLDEDVLVCGRRAEKRAVTDLIERIDGLRCVDCGLLENARVTESLTPLLIGINMRYKTRAGLRITGV